LSSLPLPNVILITADQFRADCLACEGRNPVIETPNLDQLAAEGARFCHAYSAVPTCMPARAAILTGMDQWNHGRLMSAGSDFLKFPTTLPEELTRAGYHTGVIGHMGQSPARALYGFSQGTISADYEKWLELHSGGLYSYRGHGISPNSWVARPSNLPEHLHITYWATSEAIRFIERRDPTRPFFLWLSYIRPHTPFDPPAEYFHMYLNRPDLPEPVIGDWADDFARRVDDVDAPRTRLKPEEIRRARAGYYGNITFLDHQLGRLFLEYRRMQPRSYANTLVIFTTDHGDMLGDHYHWRKSYAYEGSARIPFVIRWPKSWNIQTGQVRTEPIELRDVMPTILDGAGCEIPESVDGTSLWPLLRDETTEWREFIQGEYTHCYTRETGMQYVTDGREKYIWFHHTGEEQFFDLQSDPYESKNLATDPAVADRMALWRNRLAEINERRGDPRGQGGRLVPQLDSDAPRLSPNYARWKEAGEKWLSRVQ